MTDSTRPPLLFLDIDGPLLPFGAASAPSDHGGSSPGAAWFRPGLGAWLAGLPCVLVWATTWQERANIDAAPRLGLPALPVVVWPEASGADLSEERWFGLCWKTRTIVEWAEGRPFVWIDDEITDADRAWVATHHPGPALLRPVDARVGLLDEDLDAVRAWLRRPFARTT